MFHLDTSLSSPSVEVPDEFFDVTVQDVQRIHEDHKKRLYVLSLSLSLSLPLSLLISFSLHREALSDTPLMTQTMRMAQIEKKYESYEKAVVRVHFPDQWVLQGCFRPRESCELQIIQPYLGVGSSYEAGTKTRT